ncbi:hypothetical protein D3C86_2020580 [compost metagenome]
MRVKGGRKRKTIEGLRFIQPSPERKAQLIISALSRMVSPILLLLVRTISGTGKGG